MSKLLKANCTLKKLHIHQNNIGDYGISVIVEQLKNISTLTQLHVIQCGFTVKGTIL